MKLFSNERIRECRRLWITGFAVTSVQVHLEANRRHVSDSVSDMQGRPTSRLNGGHAMEYSTSVRERLPQAKCLS